MADDGKAAAEHLCLLDPVVRGGDRGIIAGPFHDPAAQEAGQDRLADVDQQDQQGIQTAVVAVEIRQARVAAALGADILPADPAGNEDRAVEAAQQIARDRADNEPEYDHSS